MSNHQVRKPKQHGHQNTAATPLKATMPLNLLKADPRLQMRAETSQEHTDKLVEWLKDNPDDELPPIAVFEDADGNAWVADGQGHRMPAYHLAGRERIPVTVKKGTFRDAWLCALGANERHGLPRSDADRRKAVIAALNDPELSENLAEVARVCDVSRSTLYRIKDHFEKGTPLSPNSKAARQAKEEESRPSATKAKAPSCNPGPFECADCNKSFDRFLWHCLGCGRHWLPADATCGQCGQARHLSEQDCIQAEADMAENMATGAQLSAPGQPADDIVTTGSELKLHQPEPDAVCDHFGRPVPPRLVRAFKKVHEFRSLIHRVGAFKSDVSALKGTDDAGAELLRVDAVCIDLNNVQQALRFALPFAVCPECGGHGCRGEKSLCSSRGWIDEGRFNRLTEDSKRKCQSYKATGDKEGVA